MSVLSSGILLLSCALSFLAGIVACRIGTRYWSHASAADGDATEEPSGRGSEIDRLRGVSQSLPGIEFQYHVEPGGDGHYRFVGARAEELLGLSPQADDFEEQFLRRVPEAYRDRHNRCTRAAREGESPEQVELPFDRPDGERIWLLLTSMLERRPAPDGGETLVFNGFMLDITERKQQEKTLRILSETVKQTTDGVLITEAPDLDADDEPGDGSIVYANRAFEEMTGYSEEELLGQTPELFRGPDTDPEVIADLRRSLKAQEPWEGETVNYRSDGSRYISRWSAAPVTDEDEDVRYWVSIQRDVTEKRRREQALRRQQALLEQAQRLTGAWMADLRTGEVSWSEEGYRIHELDPDVELTLEKGFEFLAPEARPEVRAAFERCVETGEPYDLEHSIITAEGNRRWVRTVGGPVGTEDGEVVEVAGAFQDITEQKRRVQELERYERLVENLPVGIFRTTESGEFVDMNAALTELFGVSEEHLRRAGSGMMYANPEDRAALLEVLRREGKVEGELFPMQTQNGGDRWTRATITLTEENGDRYLEGIIEDVTERRRAEQALRQREQRFRSLFEEHSAPMLLVDPDTGAIERANAAAATFYGYDADDLASMTVQDLNVLPPEEVAARRADADQRAQNRFVFPHQLESGEVRMVEVHSTPVTIEDQSLLFSIIHDITERKEKEREARLRSDAIEASTDGIAIIGADGTYVYVNEAHAEAYGYDDSDAMLGQSWRICYGPDELDRFDENILPQLHEEGEWRGEVTGRTADGASFPQELTLTTFGGGVTISVVRDITERKRREAVLRERQEKIEALYEATRRLLRAESREEIDAEIHGVLQDVFAYPIRHTAVVEENEIVVQNTTTEDEADLPPLSSHPVDGDTVAARALAAGEAVVVPDTRTLDNDIDYGDVRAAAGVPIGQRGVLIVGKDTEGDFDRMDLHLLEVLGGYTALVLERLRRERALRDAKEGAEAARAEAEAARDEARKAARLKSAFLANMSHEIRTPLTSIIGFAEVLGNEIQDLDASGAESLEQKVRFIQEGGNRLLDTLEGVLNLSKLEAGQMELDRHPVDLADQARRTAEELRPKADDKAIDLQVQAADPLPQAQADEGGVQIVIQNLLSNAIKYTEEGGDVWIRTYADDETVVLEVEDTGIGMEPDRAEELFEPFRQASEGMGREYEGSGVGLAVTRRAVTEMGGCVEVETEKGEGSRFVVRLPRAEPSPREQAQVGRGTA